LGAPSEDLSTGARPASIAAPGAVDAARIVKGAAPAGRAAPTPWNGRPDDGAAAPVLRGDPDGSAPPAAPADIASLAQAVVAQSRAATAGPRAARVGAPEGERAPAPAHAPPAGPRVHIGRLDVTVLAPEVAPARAAPARSAASSGDFLSRNYLRRG
jgi:hypothetical protein